MGYLKAVVMTFIHWETELGMKGMEAEISLAFLKQDS